MTRLREIYITSKAFIFNLLIGLIPIILIWVLIKMVFKIQDITIPWPNTVIKEIIHNWRQLLEETAHTMLWAIICFITSTFLGILLGIITHKSITFSKIVVPSIVISQVLPKAAMLPLLVILFGYNPISKSIVATTIGFFPIYAATINALNSLPKEWVLFYLVSENKKLTFFFRIEFPFIITNSLSFFKTSLIYVVIGIITAEVISAEKGIGTIISNAFYNNNAPIMYAALFYSTFFGGVLLYLFELARILVLPFNKWQISTLYKDGSKF
ncbi:ABC transporter permease [Maribellus sediminis]|uniref:ABC transporter permease n=1 Tax=Maribellus sediminis TaxID=2696285 RepID=UPI00143062B0|nr:ABC transporter permease subunit [Maribellus sediminis]